MGGREKERGGGAEGKKCRHLKQDFVNGFRGYSDTQKEKER